jgi:hypothetical protein
MNNDYINLFSSTIRSSFPKCYFLNQKIAGMESCQVIFLYYLTSFYNYNKIIRKLVYLACRICRHAVSSFLNFFLCYVGPSMIY